MINPNELRIGNFVDCTFGIRKIKGIVNDKEKSATVTFEDSLPCDSQQCWSIPLTPEWLEKFGFEEGKLNDFRIGYDGNDFIHSQMSVPFDGQLIKVQYIHQLQNLYFALTGEELTIKEPA